MGMFDELKLGPDVELPEFKGDPQDLNNWQTKDLMLYKPLKLENDRLYRLEEKRRDKTEEEKEKEAKENGYDSWEEYKENFDLLEDGPGFPRETVLVDEKWVDHNMHGTFEFHKMDRRENYEKFYWSYEARFTDGELDEIVFLGER